MEAKPQDMPPPVNEQDNAPAEAGVIKDTGNDNVIQSLQEEIAQLKDQRIRALAEAENIRKRALREQEESSKYAVTAFARDMVSVLENLNRATESFLAHKDQKPEEMLKTFAEGIDLTRRELLGIFERFYIKRIDPLGQKFDHNFHQAVAQIVDEKSEPGLIVQVVQAGYVIHDRLLRPAMVVVAKAPEPEKPKEA